MQIILTYIGFVLFVIGNFSSHNSSLPYKQIENNNPNLEISAQQISGKEIYTDFCIQCHGGNGKGNEINIPPLAESDWLKNKRAQSIASVKYGQSGEIYVNKKKYNNLMPPMGLSNIEVAEVMNYIMNSWGNNQTKAVTEKEVEAIQK